MVTGHRQKQDSDTKHFTVTQQALQSSEIPVVNKSLVRAETEILTAKCLLNCDNGNAIYHCISHLK